MKFEKGHKRTSHHQHKEKKCKKCGILFITNNWSQKYCGSSLKKIGCSWLNRKKNKPKIGREKRYCSTCQILFIPTGNNQKYCGSKTTKYSCSWLKSRRKKRDIVSWVKGISMKI